MIHLDVSMWLKAFTFPERVPWFPKEHKLWVWAEA